MPGNPDIHRELLSLASKRLVKTGALSPKHIAALLGGGLAVGAGGYGLGKLKEHENSLRNRNLAFGAGMAAGTLAPKIVQRGAGLLQNLGGALSRIGGRQAPTNYDQYYR